MRLLLKRRYTPRGSLGRLYLEERQLCFIREAPKACFGEKQVCLDEGVYELVPLHTEEKGWMIAVGTSGRILPKGPRLAPASHELCPVETYRADGTPLFTRLAFDKLMEELTPYWEQDEVVELQIVSQAVPYRLESCREHSYS